MARLSFSHAKVVKMPLTHKPCTHKWRNNQQPLPTLADVALLMQHWGLWPNSTFCAFVNDHGRVDAASGLWPNSTFCAFVNDHDRVDAASGLRPNSPYQSVGHVLSATSGPTLKAETKFWHLLTGSAFLRFSFLIRGMF